MQLLRSVVRLPTAIAAMVFLLGMIESGTAAAPAAASASRSKAATVYVCSCLTNNSCACMTEAKSEGPCACGSEGGPPMKGVPSDSNWAKANRAALAR